MLFDYDVDNPDSRIVDKSRELLVLVGESQGEPKSSFVSDRVAFFLRKWETDLKSEIPGFEKLTAEARSCLGLSDDSGKPLVARYIARKLVESSPPVVPQSLKLIIEKAAGVTWRGSCLSSQVGK